MEEENLSGKEKKKGFSIFKKKEIWISGIIGLVIGAILIYIFGILGFIGLTNNNAIATFKGGKITDKELYNKIKDDYGFDYALELVDTAILDNKYELTETQEKEIYDNAKLAIDSEIEQVKYYYGITEAEYLEVHGLDSKEEVIQEYIEKIEKLKYKKNLCYIDYLKTKLPEEDIQNYYNENDVYGEINTKQILVGISETVTKEQALVKANEILAKLNEGRSFDSVAIEYTDGKAIISENVDFDWLNESSLAEEYTTASKALEKDTYTKEVVLTDFGYHIIYCVDKAEKPSIEESKDDIVEKLGADLEAEDQYIRYKALIKLREDNGLKFKDSKFKEEYKEYCDEVNAAAEE